MQGIFDTGIQIFLFTLILSIGTLSFNVSYFTIYLLPILFFQNIITAIINKKEITILFSVITASIFIYLFIKGIKEWPYNNSLGIISCIITLLSKFYIDNKIEKLLERRTTHNSG